MSPVALFFYLFSMKSPFRLCLPVLLLFTRLVSAQTISQIRGDMATIPSPTAAGLGQYGQVPVSLFAGLPSISLPVYTLQEGQISLPISLNYHASGFRPDQHPGWVGQGWSLSAGGTINRVVRDIMDEDTWDGILYGPGIFHSGYLTMSPRNWGALDEEHTTNVINHGVGTDSEPDIFSFSFPGYNGEFYWDPTIVNGAGQQNGNWRVRCDKPVKIVIDQASPLLAVPFTEPPQAGALGAPDRAYRKSFKGFTVVTEEGTRFAFGGNTNAIEYSEAIFAQNQDRWTATSWNLVSITRPNGETITLTYRAGNFINQMFVHESLYTGHQSFYGSTYTDVDCIIPGPSVFVTGYNGKIIRPVYLESIVSKYISVIFNASQSTELRFPQAVYQNYYDSYISAIGPNGASYFFMPFLQGDYWNSPTSRVYPDCLDQLQWKKLDNITVYNSTQRPVVYSFTYTNTILKRLTLLSFGEINKPPYRFAYNDASIGYPVDPEYCVSQNDHWGFYNGTTATAPAPGDVPALQNYYSLRQPTTDTLKALLGMLHRITYPTGGATDFRFESHGYGQTLSADRRQVLTPLELTTLAGGVRLRAMKSYTPENLATGEYKEYFYVNGYNPIAANPRTASRSSGILGGQSQYYYNQQQFRGHYYSYTYDLVTNGFEAQSVLPGCDNNGSHVGYSEVVEKYGNGSFRRLKYTNFGKGYLDEAAEGVYGIRPEQGKYSSTKQQRGNLVSEELFSQTNHLVKSKRISYVSPDKASSFIYALSTTAFETCISGDYLGSYAAYKIFTYSVLPAQVLETVYDENGDNPFSINQLFTYNSNRLLTQENTYDSRGYRMKTTIQYATDYPTASASSADAGIQALARMNELNMVGVPVRTTQLTEGVEAAASLRSTQNVFNNVQNGVELAEVSEYQQGILQHHTTFPSFDSRGHALQVQGDGGSTASYVWGYGQTQPIATVQNASPQQIAFTSFERDSPGGWSYSASNVVTPLNTSNVHCGRSYYSLDGCGPVSRSNIPAGNYIVTLWATTQPAASLSVPGGVASALNPTTVGVLDANGWRLYSYNFQASANAQFSLEALAGCSTGATILVDDVRLHPLTAQMTSSTYDPGIGPTSKTDAGNRPTIYQYDDTGRLVFVKDAKGNIVNSYEYTYKQ